MLDACIIGISGFGAVHYHDLLREVKRGRMRALGAVVINAQEEAAKCAELKALGCEIFASHTAMFEKLKGKVQLCFIPTGIPLHAPMALAAMRAGANVFLEKPAAATIQDVRAMQACEAETGRFVAVGYQNFYGPELAWLKQALDSGAYGKILSLKCRALWPRLDDYYARNSWAGRLKTPDGAWVLDSPFNNALAHPLNVMCYLAGEVASVQAELYRGHAIESADTASIRVKAVGGAGFLFLATHCSEAELDPEVTIRTEKGELRWDFKGAYAAGESHPGLDWEPLRERMLDQVLARVADPQVPICGLAQASRQTLCVNGAHESSAIHSIPERWLRRSPSEGSVKTVIEGIDDLVLRAYAEEKLFSELGAPWALPGREIVMRGYEFYPKQEAR